MACHDPEELIERTQPQSRMLALQHNELLAEGEVLQQQAAATTARCEGSPRTKAERGSNMALKLQQLSAQAGGEVIDFTVRQNCDEEQCKTDSVRQSQWITQNWPCYTTFVFLRLSFVTA